MHRFLFDNTDIRGEVVNLAASYVPVLANNPLPFAVQRLLGEFLAAVALLSGRLKFDGILTLQARGDGPLALIMAECTNKKDLRAVAQLAEGVDAIDADATLTSLLGKGVLAMIVEPAQGQRYQGIVPLESADLAACLELYFTQSEQLPTRFWLRADAASGRAGGMMLQAMPRQLQSEEERQHCWETARALGETVKTEELLQLDHHTLLFRLFHELQVRMFDAEGVRFACRCSRQSSGNALTAMGRAEIEAILTEQSEIVVDCQFCNQRYRFDATDLDPLFGPGRENLH
jgi:molecular chaperone Hsp33